MAALFLLSSVPDTEAPDTLLEEAILLLSPTWQNLLHIPIYAGLTWAWVWALQPVSKNPLSPLWLALLFTLCWGVLDELHQATVPGRFGSVTDIGFNALGALAAVAWIYWRAQQPRRQ